MKRWSDRKGGYSLLEVMCGAAVLIIGLVSMAGVMVSVSHQRDQAQERRMVLASMQDLLEDIKGTAPDAVAGGFHQQSFEVTGLYWCSSNGTSISVNVNSTNPNLLVVTLTTQWGAGSQSGPLNAYMEIHNPTG